MDGARGIGIVWVGLWAVGGGTYAQTLDIVDDVPGMFIDISGTGTPLHLGDEDEAVVTTSVSNAVLPAGDVVIANNGGLGFRNPPSTDMGPENQPLPSTAAFGGGRSLAAFWDDIGNTMGDVYVKEEPDRLIVQWHDKPFGPRSDICRFQVQVFSGALHGDLYAQFLYSDIERPRAGGGVSATIGYQDGGAGFQDVQWSYNTSGAVANGGVLSLVPEPATLLLVAIGALGVLTRTGTRSPRSRRARHPR